MHALVVDDGPQRALVRVALLRLGLAQRELRLRLLLGHDAHHQVLAQAPHGGQVQVLADLRGRADSTHARTHALTAWHGSAWPCVWQMARLAEAPARACCTAGRGKAALHACSAQTARAHRVLPSAEHPLLEHVLVRAVGRRAHAVPVARAPAPPPPRRHHHHHHARALWGHLCCHRPPILLSRERETSTRGGGRRTPASVTCAKRRAKAAGGDWGGSRRKAAQRRRGLRAEQHNHLSRSPSKLVQ